jgi:virginiamycin B lyase
LWFTENGPGIVAQIIPTKSGAPVINEFALPNAASHPLGITTGRDGNVWFAETAGDKIGRINEKTKVITEFAVPRANSGPFWISPGPDNALWFTEINGDHLGRITYGGVITESDAVPGGPGASLSSDIKGPGSHTLLFTERGHDAVGELFV